MGGIRIISRARRKTTALAFGIAVICCFLPCVNPGQAQKPTRQVPVDSLLYDLRNPDPVRRKEAANLLGSSKVQRAVPELVAAANDQDPAVRREVITALEKLADIRALPAFTKLSGDSEKDIREKCIQGIIGLYLPKESGLSVTLNKVANFLNPWSDEWAEVVVEPGIAVDPTAVSALSERLHDPDEGIRAKAARSLGILKGKAAVPALVLSLRDDSSNNVRFEAIRSLRKISDVSVGRELINYLGYSDPRLRNEAVFTLGRFRLREAAPELTRRFEAESALPVKDQDNTYREILLEALASIGERRSEGLFQKELKSQDDVIRQHAYAGLARIGNPDPVTDVSRAHLSEKNPKVKMAQAYALFRMGRNEYLDELVKGLDSRRTNAEARQYLLELKPEEQPELLEEVKFKDVNIREGLAEVLGMIGDNRAVPTLQELSKDRRGQITALCNQALRRIEARAGS